jgi:hypothetical protein
MLLNYNYSGPWEGSLLNTLIIDYTPQRYASEEKSRAAPLLSPLGSMPAAV